MKSDNFSFLDKAIEDAYRIVFVTGAGVSTPSGVPDYNAMQGGTLNGKPAEARDMLHRQSTWYYPEEFNDWYERVLTGDYQPSFVHQWIAEKIVQHPDKHIHVVTQNIDGLHRAVFEMNNVSLEHLTEFHGNRFDVICDNCEQEQRGVLRYTRPVNAFCDNCQANRLTTNITLYGDDIVPERYRVASSKIRGSDLIIIMGTNLEVNPIGNLVLEIQGERIWVGEVKPRLWYENQNITFLKMKFQ